MTMKKLLDVYYEGLSARTGWETALADGFVFVGGNAGVGSHGKAGYAEILRQFLQMFETVSLKQVTVQGDSACAIVSYVAVSPSGSKRTFDVAEVWTARDGLLVSLAIYFDTAGWKSFMTA
jgi:ketosteroid isomerase-like protein